MSEPARTAPAARRWDTPALDGSQGPGYLTAGRLEALQKEAYDEAFQQGRGEGIAAGQEEVRLRAARFDDLPKKLAKPFDELDDAVEKHLVELAMTVVQQLFRRELHQDPSHIIGVVREAIRLLPVASRNVQVCLHPEDAAFVREALAPSEGERAWTIVEDPLIERGGCKVAAEQSHIDAQAESRLKAVIASIIGDERR
ncbi:MAG TPA: flagellar assembly protein FliH [Woeseiaceae bacterium]|nr:flagellar assembly protein FliH [Woeseiaceae bacterium]